MLSAQIQVFNNLSNTSYVAWMHRSNTCSLTPGSFCLYNMTSDVEVGLLCVQANIPERPHEVQQNLTAKGGSPFSQSCSQTHIHNPTPTCTHTQRKFYTSQGYLCVYSGSWKKGSTVNVSKKCGMQMLIWWSFSIQYLEVITLRWLDARWNLCPYLCAAVATYC